MLQGTPRAPADTSRVNLNEEWDVKWWCDQFGCTEIALRRAVDEVGDSATAIEGKLKKAAKEALKNTGED